MDLTELPRHGLGVVLFGTLWLAACAGTVSGSSRLGAYPAASGSSTAALISLTEVVADAQGNAVVEVGLSSGGQALSAVQFDITYQAQAMAFSISPGNGLGGAAKSIWTAALQPGSERLLIVGLNQDAIADGVVATLSVEMNAGAPSGVYSLELANGLACDPNGGAIPLYTIGGGVVIPGAAVSAPTIEAVGNAASYSAGFLSPGEIVVIFGDFLADVTPQSMQLNSAGLVASSLGGTTVLIGDVPAPLLYTSANQLSAIVPYEVDGQSQTSIQVECQGVRSAPLIVAVAATAPGIFTLDGSGSGQGAIVNQDGTVNGPANPAGRGDVVSIYGTGEGETVPPGTDGTIVTAADLCRPVQAVTVSIAGQSADVLYAGSAGDSVAGLLQVNARIPMGIAPGTAVPVTITVGGNSQAGVTMAVH